MALHPPDSTTPEHLYTSPLWWAGMDNKNRHAMNFPGVAAVLSFPKSPAGT